MSDAKKIESIAEDYYDSEDADNFYREIWGGEDIHIGLYEPGDTIPDASRRTVLHMASRLKTLTPNSRVLDIGAGYGGAARVIAKKYGAHVTCLNLSAVENARNAKLNKEQGLDHLIKVRHGSFENIPEPLDSFDIIWSQDAILHSGNRKRVLAEVARVLRHGGEFIFTDPMQADRIDDPAVLRPIYDRIHLDSLGSAAFYRSELKQYGFEEIGFEDFSHQLVNHYSRVAEELEARRGALKGKVSEDYIDRMLKGLGHWVEGGKRGYLKWGVLLFRKV